VYTAYLKLEHSDENIKFWMACETYKKIASRRGRISRAKKLYNIYIQPQSPREVTMGHGSWGITWKTLLT
jgi:regulator of G-protein signaling